jgi:hypothetical protein
LSERLPEARRSAPTMNYDVQAFVQGLKARRIEAHVAINGTVSKNGKDAQDRRPERGRGEPAMRSASGCASGLRNASAGARRWVGSGN